MRREECAYQRGERPGCSLVGGAFPYVNRHVDDDEVVDQGVIMAAGLCARFAVFVLSQSLSCH